MAASSTRRSSRSSAAKKKSSSSKNGAAPSANLERDELLSAYREMQRIRVFEEWVIRLFQEGILPGFLHVAIGQEAIAVGASMALEDEDYIGSTHRAHGHVLARGSDATGMMAELLGKVTGYCQGKGGSMHVADMSRNVVGANGVVGAGAPMMTGVGLAQKFQDTGRIAVAFYGDGASNQGNVHEAMNLAQLWKLPVIFLLENNRYAESTPYWQQVPVEDLIVRGAAFDMKSISVDGNDPLAVYDAVTEAAAFARSGQGPVYIVAETRRIEGHYVGDPEVYRPKGEAKEWKQGDPIPRFRAHLEEAVGVKASELDAIEAEVVAEMEQVVEDAKAAPDPAPEDALRHVYVEEPYPGPVIGV